MRLAGFGTDPVADQADFRGVFRRRQRAAHQLETQVHQLGIGGIRFAINEQHPLIASLGTRLSSEDVDLLRVLLDSIAASLPVEMIYSDYSTHPREINQRAVDESQTLERLKSLRKVLYGDGPGDPNAFLQIVRSTHLFDGQIELAEKFISETFA